LKNQNKIDVASAIEIVDGTPAYALLDSGQGRKLERFGNIIVDRPEEQAIWSRVADAATWQSAQGIFAASDESENGKWRIADGAPDSWKIDVLGTRALCRFSAFRHLGIFPEQHAHWQWASDILRGLEKPRLLNLFGYTGVASMVAASCGAEVTHVDASKKAIEWAKENQALSGLTDAPIRWIVDDARKFAAREVRRGKTYHGILVDPPKFGRGPEGEVWDLFTHVPGLLRDLMQLLEPTNNFMVLTTYAIRSSFLSIDALMREVLAGRDGTLQSGELALREESGARLLSTSLYSWWKSA
jgi:23S rRNA (cytosine1962-C5)-methyltransferase